MLERDGLALAGLEMALWYSGAVLWDQGKGVALENYQIRHCGS